MVIIIDKSSHEERRKRLEKPLIRFFQEVEREKRNRNMFIDKQLANGSVRNDSIEQQR